MHHHTRHRGHRETSEMETKNRTCRGEWISMTLMGGSKYLFPYHFSRMEDPAGFLLQRAYLVSFPRKRESRLLRQRAYLVSLPAKAAVQTFKAEGLSGVTARASGNPEVGSRMIKLDSCLRRNDTEYGTATPHRQ